MAAPVAGDDARQEFSTDELEFFEKKIRPIFVEHCHECHSGDEPEAGLLLTSRESILRGGDTGPAVVPGMLDEGELLLAVSYDPDGYQMPPDGKLPDETIELLRQWVAMGAPWPDEEGTTGSAGDEFDLAARAERFSFQPLRDVQPPDVENAAWPRTPIDRFLLAKLEEAGLAPAPATDRRTWIRRAYFDTIGLPPTPEQVQAFLDDDAPGAFERVVDGLLASPHFGERWGRHWLDLVRYAESRGHEFDYDVPNPWHYRDYVIRALNDDVPYDQFVVEHVAGDILNTDDHSTLNTQHSTFPLRLHPETGANESILGTGFWFFGEWVHSPVDIRQEEADRFDNMIDVYSKTFLGLTVACARCHDHKFDPIRQADFYAIQGYLQSSSYRQARFETMEHNRAVADQLDQLQAEAAPVLLRSIADVVRPMLDKVDQYLIAATEVIRDGGTVKSEAGDGPIQQVTAASLDTTCRERVEEVAAERRLDPHRLKHWVAHVINAADDESDPFHYAAQFDSGQSLAATDVDPAPGEAVAEDSIPTAERVAIIFGTDHYVSLQPFADANHLFRTCQSGNVMIELSDDPGAPLARIDDHGEVALNESFLGVSLSEESDHDAGRMESLRIGGRSLRTQGFEISQDKLFCWIRGGVNTYVAVDSHILINGPLHGSLIREHPTSENGSETWRCIEHDVSRYRGHRAHMEFIPRDGEEFAISSVWMGDGKPPSPDNRRYDLRLYDPRLLEPGSLQELAERYKLWLQSIDASIQWFFAESRSGNAKLDHLEWVLAHPSLFGLDTDEIRHRFTEVSTPFIERRRELISRIRPVSATAPCMLDGSGEDEYIFIRGAWKKPGETVPRRFLEVFNGHGPSTLNSQPSTTHGSGRLDLALQMIDPGQTPILPRVIVNRIWQHYFGRGIVPTPDDFGHMGQEPSHPELLDWLANDLVEHDWSLKHIHRQILLSAAYRMESRVDGLSLMVDGTASSINDQPSTINPDQIDPQNILLHRMNVKRLEGEIIRDAVLSVSGRLDETLYGRSVPVHLTPFMEGRGRPSESGPVDGNGRRSVYIAVRRNFAEPFFQAFDFPNPHTTTGRRSVSNVPAQALALMNNPLIVQQSRVWAERLLAETPDSTTAERVARLYETAFSRPPTEDELAAGMEFVEAQAAEYNRGTEDARVWTDYCHVLVNVKEFVFVR